VRLLAECYAAGRLELYRALVDSSQIHASKRGPRRVQARSTGHPGSKHHVITDATGVPPVWSVGRSDG